MKNNYLLYLLLFLVFLFSCSKQKVRLPLIESDGLSEIYNHSSIWVFFEQNEKDTLAVLNKNNKIINTHWILNIDRRLTMKYVMPILNEIQIAKYKPSMHRKDGTFNYFAYANTKSNNISLIEFKKTNFQSTKESESEHSKDHDNIRINLQKNNIFIDGKDTNWNHIKVFLEDLKINDSLNKAKVFLSYNENITYQKYLQTKMLLSEINIAIDSTENIYSLK